MDLKQIKLSKTEWDTIEVPVSENEKKILKVIMEGFENINIKYNDHLSILQLLKVNSSDILSLEGYFYVGYFLPLIEDIQRKLIASGSVSSSSSSSSSKKEKNKGKDKDKHIKKESKKEDSIGLFYHTQIEEWKKKNHPTESIKKLKKCDILRIDNVSANIETMKSRIYEYILLQQCDHIFVSCKEKTTAYAFHLYTLIHLKKYNVQQLNSYVMKFVDFTIETVLPHTQITHFFSNAFEFIEKNPMLLKYDDIALYSHQKKLFSIFNKPPSHRATSCTSSGEPVLPSRLILYMAPTGTGKTMSPIGLSNRYRIIFVCVARHVGLALAKSAISIGKKVAFAFGCETSSDIRLHNHAAVSYSIHHKTGGIYKIDNSIGTNVEIMICDVKSYLTAMYYMMAFHDRHQMITYWDEPTITMDYEDHPLHATIHRNWTENKIPNVILSCATLPREIELQDTIADFKGMFDNAEIYTITSHECKKSISLLNKEGKCCLPHLLFSDYGDLKKCIQHCHENKSLLRYLDLKEIIRFVEYIHQYGVLPIEERYQVSYYFQSVYDIHMDSIKLYYLELLGHIGASSWNRIYMHLKETQVHKFGNNGTGGDSVRKIKSMEASTLASSHKMGAELTRTVSVAATTATPPVPVPSPASGASVGILITTTDAHTLTDGPTIFLAEDVEKIGKFCIQQSKIPERVFQDILEKMKENDVLLKKIQTLEKALEDSLGADLEKERKMEKDNNRLVNTTTQSIHDLQNQIKYINMDLKYIPNTKPHQHLWAPNGEFVGNAFMPNIEDGVIREIMGIQVEQHMKLLLLMGIGVFVNQPNTQYMEIMKKLASEQKLYLIIAQSDYIYGTNYQFCHGFIGKDLTNMTQQKTIQAIGRIGRSSIQQEYTVRFRDDSILCSLFLPMTENREAINMSRLFMSIR